MPLPEDLRQEYLEAIGIESYFPRRRLACAPESVACDWPEAWTTAADNLEVIAETDFIPEQKPEKVHTEVAFKPAVRQSVEKPALSVQKETKKTELDVTEEKAGQAQETFRLQLLCIRVNDKLALINVMPHLGPKHLPTIHRDLLKNILNASGVSHDSLQMEEKPFHWPMVQGGHVDNSRSAAAAALCAYLEQNFSDWQFKNLLVMGEQAILPVFMEEDGEASRSTLENPDWNTIYTRSLDEILHSPVLKKEVWTVISKL